MNSDFFIYIFFIFFIFYLFYNFLEKIKNKLNKNLNENYSNFKIVKIFLNGYYNYLKIKLKIKNIEQISRDIYAIKYNHNNKKYIYPLVIQRGPKPEIIVYHKGIDISEIILPLFGPNLDLYGLKNITPDKLGYCHLEIFINEESRYFKSLDFIYLDF
jgi:hypothetical protein